MHCGRGEDRFSSNSLQLHSTSICRHRSVSISWRVESISDWKLLKLGKAESRDTSNQQRKEKHEQKFIIISTSTKASHLLRWREWGGGVNHWRKSPANSHTKHRKATPNISISRKLLNDRSAPLGLALTGCRVTHRVWWRRAAMRDARKHERMRSHQPASAFLDSNHPRADRLTLPGPSNTIIRIYKNKQNYLIFF